MGHNHRKIEFKSSLSNLNLVEKFVEEICDEYNIFNSYFGNILLSVTEAVKNAIVHGNVSNEKEIVTVEFESGKFGLKFRISDNGNGFDYESIPDPTDLDNEAYKNSGKGIFLINKLSDDIQYIDNGKVIEIVFRISSINKELTEDRARKMNEYYFPKVDKKVESSN